MLLVKRSELFPFMTKPGSEEDREEGKKLLSLNVKMEEQLKQISMLIQRDINDLNQKKKSVKHYSNPYAATRQLDGMFYDKRK